MGYEGTEGLAQMVHTQGGVLSNPDLCPLGQDHSALSPARDNDRGQRAYLKKPVEDGSLPGVGRTRDRAERQDLNTLPHLVLQRLCCSLEVRGSHVPGEKWRLWDT